MNYDNSCKNTKLLGLSTFTNFNSQSWLWNPGFSEIEIIVDNEDDLK